MLALSPLDMGVACGVPVDIRYRGGVIAVGGHHRGGLEERACSRSGQLGGQDIAGAVWLRAQRKALPTLPMMQRKMKDRAKTETAGSICEKVFKD